MPDFKFLFEKYVLRQHRAKYTPDEPNVRKALIQIRGNVFVDIGANRGYYCKLLRSNFKKIVAFEPDSLVIPKSADEIYRVALTDHTGYIQFYRKSNIGSANTILQSFNYNPRSNPQKNIYLGTDPIKVPCDTLDNFFGFLPPITLAKIDVEGAEFLVLEGMSKYLSYGLIEYVETELHDGDRAQELEHLFWSYNYEHTWLDPDHLLAEFRQK